MTIALLVAALWAAGLLSLVAICRSAARGDQALHTGPSDRWIDLHERPLAA